MKKKITILASIIIFFITLFIFGIKDIKTGRYSSYGKYIPNNVKIFLKNTIFLIPTLQKTVTDQSKIIENLSKEKIKTLETWNYISKSEIKKLSIKRILSKNISINNENFMFTKFLLPLPDYDLWGSKSVGYIDKFNNKFFFVSGDGVIFFINENETLESLSNKKNNIEIYKINSNLVDLVHENLIKHGKTSIKDILIKDNKIFISHIYKKKDNCHNIEIIRAKIDFNFMSFENFFSYDECFLFGNLHSTGGRMVSLNNDEILFSTGEGLNRKLAQDINSIFGKILIINIITNEYRIISMGHRNPQGLFYEKKNNIIIETEHGPDGGDEINIIKFNDKVKNYGWPISSYGNHYPGQINKYKKKGILKELLNEAPLHKSHSKYSFEEPIKYFTPSIGISEIIKLPNNLDNSLKDYYLVGAMGKNIDEGDKSLYYFKLNKNKIVKIDNVLINERIRDIKFDDKNKFLIMVLENTPSIGFILLNK